MRERYSKERQAEKRMQINLDRPFIAWDGEGINLDGARKPQAYVLFGNSDGLSCRIGKDNATLPFTDCVELIIQSGINSPNAFHVGFGFDYDVNQIVRTLPYRYLQWLNRNGHVRFGPYRISWRKGKSFTVSKTDPTTGRLTTVTIFDIFSFFACSFVKALEAVFGEDSEYKEIVAFIKRGKARRGHFTLQELDDEIVPYWSQELRMLASLADRFRSLLYSADFPITQWYGPGAIASLVLSRNNIHHHMQKPPDPVIEASQYAYAGGRFELFRIGRHDGPTWSIDINSAYPDAISLLPSLAGGEWVYQEINELASAFAHTDIIPFAIYNVVLSHPEYRIPFAPSVPPSPLFHRTSNGEILYPWHTEGWYWGPEVANLTYKPIASYARLLGVWIFKPLTNDKPFHFIRDMYEQRKEWKRSGRPEQLALKLAMNSIYGKLAQRVGWEHKQDAPTWHQLEWAGFVTSYVRARLWRTLWQLGPNIISVETDGIYVARDPSEIGIKADDELGGWSVDQYDELIYLQSGTYWIRSGDTWKSKYRGLDSNSLTREMVEAYLQTVEYRTPNWKALTGTTTRYIGLSAAMAWSTDNPAKFRSLHGVWFQEKDRDIIPGKNGKRAHVSVSCVECAQGRSPYETMHYQSIGVCLRPDNTPVSTQHYLPWRNPAEIDKIAWRKTQQFEQGKLFDV